MTLVLPVNLTVGYMVHIALPKFRNACPRTQMIWQKPHQCNLTVFHQRLFILATPYINVLVGHGEFINGDESWQKGF